MTFTLMDPREIKTHLAVCVLYTLSLVISIKFLFSRLEILINELYRIASLVFFCWMKFWFQLFSFNNKKNTQIYLQITLTSFSTKNCFLNSKSKFCRTSNGWRWQGGCDNVKSLSYWNFHIKRCSLLQSMQCF